MRTTRISIQAAFRKRHIEMDCVVDAYPGGTQHLNKLNQLREVPEQMTSPDSGVDPLLLFAASTSKNWEDPASVENVICLPSDPAIYGSIMGTVANPNLVYQEYCGMAEQMERSVVRQMASLVGYDPELATGVFTQGGTFCNMYGYLFGLRKSLPKVTHKMLTQQLRELESDEIIKRKVYPEVPPKVEYSLTLLGKSVMPVIDLLNDWGEEYSSVFKK